MIRTLTAVLTASAGVILAAAPAAAQKNDYNISAGSLKSALDAYVRVSGRQIVYRADEVATARSPGARGNLSADAALDALLAGSGFTTRIDGNLIAIIKGSVSSGDSDADRKSRRSTAEAAFDADEILVTGSRLRGAPSASPTSTVTREEMRDSGYSDLGQVVRSLPQNFRGGQNPGVVGAGGQIANQNLSGGSGLNLRGLGPDATLTLLNGRRLASSGLFQAVDISAIPLEAVDRLEVVTDGASAIYGSDAVAGVGNILLRRDFEGLALRAEAGGATDGGLSTQELAATAGLRWDGGGVMMAALGKSSDPIFARQRSYTRSRLEPTTIYASNRLGSGLVSFHQTIGTEIDLALDGMYAGRRSNSYTTYSFAADASRRRTENAYIAPSIKWRAGRDWTVMLGGSWSRDSNVVTISSAATPAEERSPLIRNSIRNRSLAADINAEGPILQLPGGAVRLAIGAGFRRTSLLERELLSDVTKEEGTQRSKFVYGELGIPLVGPALSVPGIHRLIVTAAVRAEDYNDFGSVATPKLGLIYNPVADLTMKASWGRSFKAPTLLQQRQGALLYNMPIAYFSGGAAYPPSSTVLVEFGGNPDLSPERAETLSLSAEYKPAFVEGLAMAASWYHINYRDRVVSPIPNFTQALNDPLYAPYVSYAPGTAQIAAAFQGVQFLNYAGTYDPADVIAILHNRYTNAIRQRVSGIDANISYRRSVGRGSVTLSGSGSYLDLKQKTIATQPSTNIDGRVFYPANFNARAGLTYAENGISASLFGNYTGSVRLTDLVLARPQSRSGSFTTIDLTARYAFGGDHGPLSGMEFVASVQNLFDRRPPLYSPASPDDVPYDSTNYSAIGRYLTLSLSKRW